MNLKKLLTLTLAAAGLATAAFAADTAPAAAPAAPPKPAILFDIWSEDGTFSLATDRTYMTRLQAAGFEVDAIAHRDLTWERLKNYNVLVLVDFPPEGKVTNTPMGGPGSGPNLDETLALADRFLADGGGVMSALIQHAYTATFYNPTQKALARWGARKPLERVVMAPDRFVQHPRLMHAFYLTDNVVASPVSEGVRRVWYPQNDQWGTGGPIDVDDTWQVVLRAPKGSRSEPLVLPEKVRDLPWYTDPFFRPDGVTEPALFAIRDLGPGRLALFHAHPFYHISSGLSWVHNGAMLDKGLNNQSSDFGKLLDNTFRWLAAPSLANGKLGGYVAAADRWLSPQEKKSGHAYRRYLGNGGLANCVTNYDLAPPSPAVKLFKGVIGARTAYSGGQGTVAEYAAVARGQGLSFVAFLEDLAELTPEKLAQLEADCQEQSGDDLLLLAGYRVKSNLGNQFFHIGPEIIFPHDKYLSVDKRTLVLQSQDKDGKWKTSEFIEFIFKGKWESSTKGWFDFTGPMKSGGLALHDLKLFSMAGVLYYRDGKLVEDVTEQHLLTNAGTMAGVPVAINLVDSPAELADAVATQAVTYATASSIKELWRQALRWNSQFDAPNVFPSSGPKILRWPQGHYRTGAYSGELFAAARMLVAPLLQVTAEAGLKEVSLYEGDHLFRRFLPNGAREFSTRLFLSGSFQRNLTLVATDLNGGKAVSFPLRGWCDSAPSCLFCGDHVNEGSMKLYRGPGSFGGTGGAPLVQDAGKVWDGQGTIAKRPLFGWEGATSFQTTDGLVQGGGVRYYQTPVMELCDERAWRGRSVSRGVQLPGSPHRLTWKDWGPITPTPLADVEAISTQWSRYLDGTGREEGPGASLHTQIHTFKQDATLTHAGYWGNSSLGYAWRKEIAANVLLVLGRGDRLLKERDAAPKGSRQSPGAFTWRIETGDWFAAISPNEANSQLWINRGVPLELYVDPNLVRIWEAYPKEGLPVKAGDSRVIEWFSWAWPMDKPVPGTDELLRWMGYLQQPDGLELLRGQRLDAPPGVIELAAADGAVEFKVPRPADRLDANLPFRVAGFNPRWSAILWQKDGYVGADRYGKPQNRFRSLATDFDGRVYFPVPSDQAALHHLVAGQPVVADAAGKDLFINVVCLKDTVGATPPLWHVSVNNPTDAPVTAKLTRTMNLPGLAWAGETITLQPGEQRILAHPETGEKKK